MLTVDRCGSLNREETRYETASQLDVKRLNRHYRVQPPILPVTDATITRSADNLEAIHDPRSVLITSMSGYFRRYRNVSLRRLK